MGKTTATAMNYEATEIQDVSRRALRKAMKLEKNRALKNISSSYILLYLAHKHRVGLLIFTNLILIAIVIARR